MHIIKKCVIMRVVKKFQFKLLLLNPNNFLNYKYPFHLNVITIKF